MATTTITPTEAPPGYPFDFERTIELRDGSSACVRPIVPADADELAYEIGLADAETLYFRFFTPTVRLDVPRLKYLTEIDYEHRFALAAFDPDGEGVGIARYEGTGTPGEAEVAVTVKPGHRRIGLASTLFSLLEEAAGKRGIRRLVANYLAENDAAEGLMKATGFSGVHYDGGIATVTKEL